MGTLSRGFRAGSLVIPLLLMAAADIAAQAAEISWIGDTDELWSTPTNWSPIEIGDPPQMIQRVPEDGNDVVIGDTTHGSRVLLDADSAVLSSLTLSGGMELDTGGYLLEVGDGIEGVTMLTGSGTSLAVPRGTKGFGFRTGQLRIDEEASLDLRSGVMQVRHLATIGETGRLVGDGDAIFGTDRTPTGTVALINDGTIAPRGPRRHLLLARGGAAELDLDGSSEEGVVEFDNEDSVELYIDAELMDPLTTAVKIEGGDTFYAYSPLTLEHVIIEIERESAFGSIHIGGTETTIENASIRLGYGHLSVDGGFRIVTGELVARGHVTMQRSDLLYDLPVVDTEFGTNTQFFLEDGSSLSLPSFSNTTGARIRSREIDLDGDNGDVEITIGLWSSLLIETTSVDNDPSSPGFDGVLHVDAGTLTMNIESGWELDGRLELGTNSHRGSAQLYGTQITVDGGEPGDGILVRGRDLDNREDITVHTDVFLTENARIAIDEELGFLKITGSLEADGTLEYVKVYEDYHPPVGNSYHLIEAEEGISGRFAALDFFALPEDRSWYVEYGPTSVTAHVIEPLPGDYNASGLVEQADLDLVLGNWGRRADELPAGWVNDLPSGIIDQAELDRVLAGWGDQVILPAAAAAMAVPEPAGCVLALLGSLALVVSVCPRRARQPC